MNPEESQQHQDQIRALARELSAAEDRATIWKFLAIAITLIALYCILDLRGCIP